MTVSGRSWWRAAGAVVATATWLAPVAAGETSAAGLPNACTLLASANPQGALGHGKALAVGHQKLQKYGTGATASSVCSETVGTQPVTLGLSGSGGGFGGVKVTSQTHPSGLGSGATLTVGTAPSGGPVDFVSFHRGSVWADLGANGANSGSLTTLARSVYQRLP
jgi:hypothetical protein